MEQARVELALHSRSLRNVLLACNSAVHVSAPDAALGVVICLETGLWDLAAQQSSCLRFAALLTLSARALRPGLLGQWPAEDREMEALSCEVAVFHLGDVYLVDCPLASEGVMVKHPSILTEDT